MRINNNSAAFNVWTNYTQNSAGMQESMKKLSTGMISSTDDPAGVGISERMRAQIKGIEMARNNTDNTVSLLQTADSWLQKVNDQLSRMKALAIESNGVTSATDKENIQTEFKAMQDEILRITSKYTSAAKFNGLYLFRGGNGVAVVSGDGVETNTLSVQVGADVSQTVNVELKNLQVSNTDVIGTVHTYTYDASNAIQNSSHVNVQWNSVISSAVGFSAGSADVSGKIDVAIDHIANARASMAAQQKRLDYTSSGLLAYEDNVTAAESKIRDIDMARETTTFSKYNILSQASNAMLAQANQMPSSVLSLLG